MKDRLILDLKLSPLKLPALAAITAALITSGTAVQASDVPDFMKPFVDSGDTPTSKEKIAIDEIYTLNDEMFNVYDKSLARFKQNFLAHNNLILALFSGKGGRFILYRAGQPPLEADPPPPVYGIAKSVGHCAMATFDLVAPYVANPSKDLSWLGEMKVYRTRVHNAYDSLDAVNLKEEDRNLLRDALNKIEAFQDKCIDNRGYTYEDVQSFARGIKPDLAKLIDVAAVAQVGHWWKVMEEWKQMLGKDWDNTYAMSNSIYVTRQNNILFTVLVNFFGEKAINDRVILLETTDFTAPPEAMLVGFMRIISDRMIGETFYKCPQLMDYELLGSGGRRAIAAEAAKRGQQAVLSPLVPYNSHGWPWKSDPTSGTGPATLEDIP